MNKATSRLLQYNQAGSAAIINSQLPDLSQGMVRVRALFSGISRGTESLVYHGLVPASEHERMRCPHMVGSFSFPVSYGYCCVGEVVETGENVTTLDKGQTVFVLHPHQSAFCVDEAMCNRIPDNVPPGRAVLAANMETAINAVWDAGLPETKISGCAVIGAGVVGLLTAHAVREIAGVVPLLVDIDPAKEALVRMLGFDFATPEQASGYSANTGIETIFHTSASGGGLQTAIDLAAFEARIVEMSWYGEKPVTLNLGGAFHSRRLQIISSQVGTIAPSRRQTHAFADRMQAALGLLAHEKLDQLLEPAIEFEDLPNHLDDIFSPSGRTLCQLVHYG